MDCRQAGPYIDPSIISRMVRCLRVFPPYRLPRADCWRQAGPLCTPSMCARWRHEARRQGVLSRARSSTTSERPRGGCTRALVRRRSTMQSIPEGAAPRVPGLCERFNGLRDPNMTLVLTGRTCYSRMGGHPGPPLEFCNYLMLQPGSHYPKVC
jgi:hypothetical protein